MAKLVTETFQVCLGTGVNDPSPTIFARGLMVAEDALALRDRLLQMAQMGQLDPALTVGNTFFVRTTPGAQTRPVADQTLAAVRAALAAERFSFPLYVKTTDDADSNAVFVRVGTLPSTATFSA
jgi:hypothetical protein